MTKGVLHKSTANRKKSRLSAALQKKTTEASDCEKKTSGTQMSVAARSLSRVPDKTNGSWRLLTNNGHKNNHVASKFAQEQKKEAGDAIH